MTATPLDVTGLQNPPICCNSLRPCPICPFTVMCLANLRGQTAAGKVRVDIEVAWSENSDTCGEALKIIGSPKVAGYAVARESWLRSILILLLLIPSALAQRYTFK